VIDALLSILYVPSCAACDARVARGAPLCAPCAASLEPISAACPRCAEPLAGPVSLVCARCRRRPLPIDGIVSPWRYGGELGRALRRLKFERRPDLGRALAPLIAPFLAAAATAAGVDLVVPVPLHWRRLVARGYNQADVLCRHAAAQLAVPCRPRLLRRRRATQPQTGLSARHRARNLDGAFAVPTRSIPLVTGRRVLLFDDVVTTGATLAAAARALRAAGAASVHGFAVARADG